MTTQKNFDILENEQFTLIGRTSATEHYAEGMTQMFFGFPFVKVLLHTTIEPKNGSNRELRKAEQYLTLPTVAAIDLAHLILSTAKQSETQLLKDVNENAREKISEILNNYHVSVPAKGVLQEEKFPPVEVNSKKKK